MTLGIRGAGARCAAVQLATTGGLGLTWLVTRSLVAGGWRAAATGHLAGTELDRALAELCASVLLGCALWLWLATTAVVVEALRGVRCGRTSPPGVPAVVRRLVLTACGVALLGGAVQPAWAATTTATMTGLGTHGRGPDPVTALDGLRLPDRAVGPGPAGHRVATRATGAVRTVLVEPGDTLWGIAAADLPADADAARIDRRWRAVYALNRTALGADPDLIEPGQQLRLPRKDPS